MAATRTQIYLTREDVSLQQALDDSFGSMPHLEVPSRDEWDRGYG